jgi:hypothetical protein
LNCCRAQHQLSRVCNMGLLVTDDQRLAWANTSAENAPSFMHDHWHSGEYSLYQNPATPPASYLLARLQISAPVPTKPSQSPQVSAPPPNSHG